MSEMQEPTTRPVAANPLRILNGAGQSPWYDNVARRLFTSGEFARLINDYGIVGVTSNPTIFDKAISGSDDYDEQMRGLLKSRLDARAVYDELAVADIGTAADALLDVYTRTDGLDGYVSIEVLPQYAYDSRRTVEYARKIYQRLNRKNILIKVPGTREGLPAITALIAEGISVNVTLLFSVAQYEACARAYIEGLKVRSRAGGDLRQVTSVASVFVSRIDTAVDKTLDSLASGEDNKLGRWNILSFKNKAAVANSKIVYQRFKELFGAADVAELMKKGARVQRVLWASTSMKDPGLRDVKYVEELIGPDTINTMPHQTLMAFYDHGIVKTTLDSGIEGARKVFKELDMFGISVDRVCVDLQKDGVKAFVESFNSLIHSIEKKMKVLQK
ncbi:MAG: transaldolase [Candidatus Omnitrophota bacterium]